MLTADLVNVRRRGDLLSLVPLSDEERRRALELGRTYLELAQAHRGLERRAFTEACRQVPVAAREQKLAAGLLKLVTDGCLFEQEASLPCPDIRAALFQRASTARKTLEPGETFDRQRVIAETAAHLGLTSEAIESGLFADLPDSHLLKQVEVPSPAALVDRYDRAQAQAVLLRAVRVRARVWSTAPGTFRDLFRRLKFHRLLFQIRPLPEKGGYEIDLDGPFSLFESVTKYGLNLALAFPALTACERWQVEAELRWGKDRRPLRFQLKGENVGRRPGDDGTTAPPLADEVRQLWDQLKKSTSPWQVALSDAVLDLPGVGLAVPDLQFTHEQSKAKVYLECLGFWSRDAVWRRMELMEKGLGVPLVLAFSKHLRVSEAALPDELPGALYVYNRTMSAKAVLDKVQAASERALRRAPRASKEPAAPAPTGPRKRKRRSAATDSRD